MLSLVARFNISIIVWSTVWRRLTCTAVYLCGWLKIRFVEQLWLLAVAANWIEFLARNHFSVTMQFVMETFLCEMQIVRQTKAIINREAYECRNRASQRQSLYFRFPTSSSSCKIFIPTQPQREKRMFNRINTFSVQIFMHFNLKHFLLS